RRREADRVDGAPDADRGVADAQARARAVGAGDHHAALVHHALVAQAGDVLALERHDDVVDRAGPARVLADALLEHLLEAPDQTGLGVQRERGARGPVALEDVDLVADLAGLVLQAGRPGRRQVDQRLLERDVRPAPADALRQPDVGRLRGTRVRLGREAGREVGHRQGPGLRELQVVTVARRRGRRRGRSEQQRGEHGARGRGAHARARTTSESIAHCRQSTGRARAYWITLPSLDVRSGRARSAFAWALGTVAFLVAVQLLWGPPAGIVVQGAILGGLSALLALGLALVYRANRILNFAQGDLGAAPASLAVLLVVTSGASWVVAFVVGIVAAVVLGAAVELLVIRRFFRSPRLILTVATIGLAQLLAGLGLLLPG